MLSLIACLVALQLSGRASASPDRWQQVAPLSSDATANALPDTRYSHCAATVDNKLVVTHGYFFNVKANAAAWLDDTWTFDFASHSWSKIIFPSDHEIPEARYSATCAQHKGDLILHGGDDGGNSRNIHSYVHSFYADVWKFSMRSQTWTRISSNTCADDSGDGDHGGSQHGAGFFSRLYGNIAASASAASRCAPRVAHGASAVVGDALYSLCGLVHPTPEQEKVLQRNIVASADVWRFDLVRHRWQRLRVRGADRAGSATPEERFATSAAAFGDKIFLFGGYSLKRAANFHDLWMLDLSTHVWIPVTAPADHASSPGARGYHNMLVAGASLFLFGGAQCSPGCVCNNELWHLSLKNIATAADALLLTTHAHNISSSGTGTGAGAGTTHTLDAAEWSIIERDERVGAASRSAEEVIRAGDWPVHRYRQSLNLFRDASGLDRLVVFGGESYRPSAYYRDVWTLDVTRLRQPLSDADASRSAQRAEAASAAALADSLMSDSTALRSRMPVWFVMALVAAACVLCVCRRARKKRKSLLD